MELVFMLTEWVYAQEGSKATSFDHVCKALAVQFDFSRSEAGLVAVCNTEACRQELVSQLLAAIERGSLDKQETLALRGRLGFADSFLHGRVGKLVLKQLVDHAYGQSRRLTSSLVRSWKVMAQRLQSSKPKVDCPGLQAVVRLHRCQL